MTLAATRDAAAPAIAIEGLELTFRNGGEVTPVLRGLDLTVRRGEFLAIVGSSGVGKSTLLRVLMNLAQPSAGTVRLTPDPEAERPLALVFQEARLLPWRRVLANVAFGLEKSSLPATARRERALAALHLVRLDHLAERWPYQLSGGQRQRVALARALAVRPSILLMDEPFSALDITTRETLQDEILHIHTETDKTILFVTHDIDEAVYLADRVIALGGKPGEVRSERIIDVPRPRRRDSRALADFVAEIRADLTADARAQDDWVI